MDSPLLKDKKKMIVVFIIILIGLDIAIFVSKLSRLLGVVILAFGIFLFIYFSASEQGMSVSDYVRLKLREPAAGRTEKKKEEGAEDAPAEKPEGPTPGLFVGKPVFPTEEPGERALASRLIGYFSTGKLRYLFPVMGLLFIIAVPVYNLLLETRPHLGSNDIVMLLVGAILLFYHRIPDSYEREKDFAVVFFVLLFLIVVLPTTYYGLRYDTTEGGWEDENPNSPLVATFLARPVSKVVKAFGVDSYSKEVEIWYEKQYDYKEDEDPRPYGNVSIALGCTGLYSVSIFLSGFIAFISVEYRRFDHKVAILLALGIISSYVANLMRMSIIVLVGSYYGSDALIWTHKNLGEVIFVLWILLFWSFMFRYLFDEERREEEPVPILREGLRGVVKKR